MTTTNYITNSIKQYLDNNKYDYLHLRGMSKIDYISLTLGIVDSIRLWSYLMKIDSSRYTVYSRIVIEHWKLRYKHEIKIT